MYIYVKCLTPNLYLTKLFIASDIKVTLMICVVAQAKVPLPPPFHLPLCIITKIHNLSLLSQALLAMIKGIIRPRPLGLTHS